MAVALPGKFIYLATMHTGSMAITDVLKQIPGTFVPQNKRKGIGQHATLEQVKQVAGDKLEGGEVVFTFIRNPYDLFVTWYLRQMGKSHMLHLEESLGREPTLLEFLRPWHEVAPWPHMKDGRVFYHAKDAHVSLRYERDLTKEVNSLLRKLPHVPSIEVIPTNVTTNKDHWSTYYDKETYAFVNEAFKQDFVEHGYQFLWG